jgi:beta-phosphoglucomutase-like phosphatase (HAD superfamily)
MDFNAAIFDLDGTILDSMDVWEHIDIQFLKKRNLPVPENYVTEICARSFEEAAQYTIDLFGLQETVEGIIEEWNNMAVEAREKRNKPVSFSLHQLQLHQKWHEAAVFLLSDKKQIK